MLMAPALYFTYTRSALLALLLGLVALALFLRTRIRGEVILAALLLFIGFIEVTGIMGGQYLGGRAESVQEESAISRQILWQAGVNIAIDNPILGIGGDQYAKISPQYAASVDPSLLDFEEERYWGYRTLGSEQVHNDFLKVWISYGTLALAAYLWLFFAVLRNFLDSYQMSRRRFIKGLSIGLAAALVVYGANAFYHNLIATIPLLWILAGFSLATAKLALERKGKPSGRITATTSG
jgi:O-antigen ligase